MEEFYFHGRANCSGEEIVENINALDLDIRTKKFYRDLFNASLELGGIVRSDHDNDCMAIPRLKKMEASKIVNMLVDKYGISGEQRELAFDICQIGYSEAQRLSGEKPDSYDAIIGALE